jgi:thioredoxin
LLCKDMQEHLRRNELKMNITEFKKELEAGTLPVVVEFWAGWCRPCKAMAPGLKMVSQEMDGRVRLLKINADENPEVLKALGVIGIPTMIGYKAGTQVARRTGAMQVDGIRAFFEAVEKGEAPQTKLSTFDRVIRLVIALAFIVLGTVNGINYWQLAIGAIVLFSAVYDRCPIYKAIAPRSKGLFKR